MAEARDFSRFYFDDVLEWLTKVSREELPEHTETSPRDPLVAMRRLYAYVAHSFGAKLDTVAAEMSAATANRRPSWVGLGRLAGYTLAADSPATVDIVADLNGVPGVADVLIPNLGQFSSSGDERDDAVIFEYTGSNIVSGTLDRQIVAFDSPVFSAPAANTIAAPFAAVNVGDALYYGHPALQFTEVTLDYTAAIPAGYSTVLDYYDAQFHEAQPDSVADLGAGVLLLIMDDFLDVPAVVAAATVGLVVSVQSRQSGNSETGVVFLSGGQAAIQTTTYLGQAVPSTAASDYILSADWLPLADTDRVVAVTDPETVSWALPQSATRKWQRVAVGGLTAYWVRDRVYTAPAPVAMGAVAVTFGTDNTFSTLVACLQGRSVVDTLGTSTGTASQTFRLNEGPFVQGSITIMDIGGDAEWIEVASLFDSTSDDKHFQLRELPDGTLQLVFGDGTTGQIPPAGALATVTYRTGADDDGNVGAGAVTNVEAGLRFLTNVRNPRDASGWRQREGADEAGIETLRLRIPGSIRARTRAVSPEDAAALAVAPASAGGFETADGRSPFERAIAVEQGAGFKTLRLVLIGAGGTVPTAADIAELDEFFNGTTTGLQRFGGIALANQRVFGVAYTPVPITVTVAVTVAKRFITSAAAAIEAAIRAGVDPLAKTLDGFFRWTVDTTIQERAFTLIIADANIPAVEVTFALPVFPLTLASTELFTLAAVNVTVLEA